ncbi:hypothetical protein BAE44_0017717, partial [Dichanthelium oligosanthes]
LNDFIPSRANLHRRHIDQQSTCEVCGAREENTYHALVECTHAKLFWSLLKELTPHHFVAQAEACRDGIRLAAELGVSKLVVDLWGSRNTQSSEIMSIFAEIQELSLNFSSFSIVFVRRSANLAAHVCAKEASPSRSYNVPCLSQCPVFLRWVLYFDCNPANE